MKLAKKHKLLVIEDAAEAIGAEYKGKKCGSFGDISCFSFYPNKTITTGEGGMLTTSDDKVADWFRKARLHGLSKDAWKRYNLNSKWIAVEPLANIPTLVGLFAISGINKNSTLIGNRFSADFCFIAFFDPPFK